MHKNRDNRPLTYRLAGWYAFIFSVVFLVYGGVKVILGFLDRNYGDLGQPIIFGAIGIGLISFAYAYKELRAWGWYGLVAVNSFVILLALLGYSRYENIVLLVLSGVALYSLLSPQTKRYVFKKR